VAAAGDVFVDLRVEARAKDATGMNVSLMGLNVGDVISEQLRRLYPDGLPDRYDPASLALTIGGTNVTNLDPETWEVNDNDV
jgi:hypothetical protein